jgi:hypothetical protein
MTIRRGGSNSPACRARLSQVSSRDFPNPISALCRAGPELRGGQAVERAFECHALGGSHLGGIRLIDHISAIKLLAHVNHLGRLDGRHIGAWRNELSAAVQHFIDGILYGALAFGARRGLVEAGRAFRGDDATAAVNLAVRVQRGKSALAHHRGLWRKRVHGSRRDR